MRPEDLPKTLTLESIPDPLKHHPAWFGLNKKPKFKPFKRSALPENYVWDFASDFALEELKKLPYEIDFAVKPVYTDRKQTPDFPDGFVGRCQGTSVATLEQCRSCRAPGQKYCATHRRKYEKNLHRRTAILTAGNNSKMPTKNDHIYFRQAKESFRRLLEKSQQEDPDSIQGEIDVARATVSRVTQIFETALTNEKEIGVETQLELTKISLASLETIARMVEKKAKIAAMKSSFSGEDIEYLFARINAIVRDTLGDKYEDLYREIVGQFDVLSKSSLAKGSGPTIMIS